MALAVAPPSATPLQVTLESTTLDAAKATGSVIVTLELFEQPFPSVIVTLYDPADTPIKEDVVAELLQA